MKKDIAAVVGYPTVKAFLESTYNSKERFLVRPSVICNDGFTISIQGGDDFHYCTPRKRVNEYEAVELGYPSESDPLIMEYAEDPFNPTNTVYGFVPLDVVEKLIAKHGGISHIPQY